MNAINTILTCANMRYTNGTCDCAVTHIGNKGYVYCAICAVIRRQSGYERTRRLTKTEMRLLQSGEPIRKY